MKAMILAAGRGERMRPLTDTTPKPLLEVGGQPLIVWHLCRLKKAGIEQIVINHAWLGHKIEEVLGDGSQFGVSIAYSPEAAGGLETAGGIATALPLLGSEPFLVVNGDVLTDIDFKLAVRTASEMSDNTSAYLWMVDNPKHHPNGDFVLFSDGMMASEGAGALTFSGVGVYRPELFADTPPHQAAKLAPLLRKAMNDGKVRGRRHQGFWLDVGTVERLKEAEAFVAKTA